MPAWMITAEALTVGAVVVGISVYVAACSRAALREARDGREATRKEHDGLTRLLAQVLRRLPPTR